MLTYVYNCVTQTLTFVLYLRTNSGVEKYDIVSRLMGKTSAKERYVCWFDFALEMKR